MEKAMHTERVEEHIEKAAQTADLLAGDLVALAKAGDAETAELAGELLLAVVNVQARLESIAAARPFAAG
jgi:hypothetical protein